MPRFAVILIMCLAPAPDVKQVLEAARARVRARLPPLP